MTATNDSQKPATGSKMNDDTFIALFEDKTLPPEDFNHLGHLRIAWLYLNRFDVEQAVDRVCSGIKAYAESLGAATKFHFTITDAIVRIMAGRKQMMAQPNWPQFLDDNADLVENAIAVIHQYYSKEVLNTERARVQVLQPDLKAI